MSVPHYGDFAEDDTVHMIFNTFTSDDPAASATITNLADADIKVHKDGGLTQIATDGATVTIDFDSITGNHLIAIDTSASADYSTGSEYQVRIEGTTVDAATINAWVGSFSIERAGGALALIKLIQAATITNAAGTDIAADIIAMKAETALIVADTSELQVDDYPARFDTLESTLGNITNVGSAVNTTVSTYVLTTGTQSSGTFASTAALDGTNHEHTSTAGAMDLYYEFNIGAGAPASATVTGYLNGNNDNLEVYGYDWVADDWAQIGTMAGITASANEVNSYELFTSMVGTGANRGLVRIRFTDGAFTLTSATLAVDQIFVSFSQGVEGYENGSIWYDTAVTNTGTVLGVDGTAGNPVSTEAAALTLLSATNLHTITSAPGSTFTAAATINGTLFQGHNYSVALGGQDLDECHFSDCDISGTATAATEMEFHECDINTANVQRAHFYNCLFNTTVTLSAAGDYSFINCQSGVAGSGSPTVALGTGNITCEFRRWSGGITFSGITAGDTLTVGGELGTVDLGSPSGGTVEIRGTYKAITNTGSATVNLAGAIKGEDVAAILVDTSTTIPGTITTMQGNVTDILADTDELQTDDVPGLIAALNNVAATDIVSGGAITTSGGIASADTKKINGATVVGDGNATPWDGA